LLGQYFLSEARALLQDLERLMLQTKQAEAGLVGHIRLGMNFSAPFHPMTSKLLQAFRIRFPHIHLELALHERPNILQLTDISSSGLDAALIWLDVEHKKHDIVRVDLAKDPIEAVVPTDHPLAERATIPIQALRDLPFISQSRHAGTQRYDCIMQAFASIGAQPKTVYEALQMPLAMSMVAAGQGVSLLPSFLRMLPIAGAVFKPLKLPKGKPPVMTYNLIVPKPLRSEAVRHLVSFAEEFVKTQSTAILP
jgi:DNA-binding transcriptional LysR family regulator